MNNPGYYGNAGLSPFGKAQLENQNASTAATYAQIASQRSNMAGNAAALQMQLAQMGPSPYFSQIMKGLDQNRGAIDQRFSQAMSGLKDGARQQVADYLSAVDGMGEDSRQRIYRDATAARNSVGSQLAGTGLYNSTVMGSMQAGVDRDRNEALGALDEQLRRERANTLNDITAQALNRQAQFSQGQLGMLGEMASQQAQMDMALRGSARDSSKINPALIDAIATGKQYTPATSRRR